MLKKLTTLEILNICAWYKKCREDANKPLSVLPLTVQWKIKNNVKKIQDIADNFSQFRDEADNEIREEYISDEKSEESTDENGLPIRKIKDEYLEGYQAKITELNAKLTEIVESENEIDFDCVDINAIVEQINDPEQKFTIDDLEILMTFMDNSEE